MRKLLTKGDISVIIVIAVLCMLLFLPKLAKNDSPVAEIYVDSVKTQEIDLDKVEKAYTITPVNGTEITVKKGKISFTSSDCKDKICVSSGWLSANGQTSACLPKRVVIVVKSAEKSPDIITY